MNFGLVPNADARPDIANVGCAEIPLKKLAESAIDLAASLGLISPMPVDPCPQVNSAVRAHIRQHGLTA